MTPPKYKAMELFEFVENNTLNIEMINVQKNVQKNNKLIKNDYQFVDKAEACEYCAKPASISTKVSKYLNKIWSVLEKKEDVLVHDDWFEPTI